MATLGGRTSSTAMIVAGQNQKRMASRPSAANLKAKKASQAVIAKAEGDASVWKTKPAGSDEKDKEGRTISNGKLWRKEMDKTGKDEIFEHRLEPSAISDLYNTNCTGDGARGLDQEAYDQHIKDFGLNQLTPPKVTPLWVKFIMHQVTGFALLLWGGSLLCFTVYILDSSSPDNLYLGIVLGLVVFSTGCFSFYQEYAAESTMAGFSNMQPDLTCVFRNCEVTVGESKFAKGEKVLNYPAENLVPGDIVEVTMGQKIPADMVVLSCSDMKVDHAALTGEPLQLGRSANQSDEDTTAWEAKNVIYYGTFCVQGSCKGVVVRTGDVTAVGKIAAAVTQEEKPMTTMEIEIEHFIHLVSGVAITIGTVFFIIALVTGYTFVEAIIFMIGIIVANVPEGLLATVTVALSLTARQMFKHNVLVKSAQTIETLGSITTVASDKTGTLTKNQMTAQHAIYSMDTMALDPTLNADKDVAGGKGYDMDDEDFARLQRVSCLCGSTIFKDVDEGVTPNLTLYDEKLALADPDNFDAGWAWHTPLSQRKVKGDASEGGLLKFNEPLYFKHWWQVINKGTGARNIRPQYVKEYRAMYKQVGAVPFNSVNKFMVTMHECNPDVEPDENRQFFKTECDVEDKTFALMIKGAPEKMIDNCAYYYCKKASNDRQAKVNAAAASIDAGEALADILAAHATTEIPESQKGAGVYRSLDWVARYDKDVNEGKTSTVLRPYGSDGATDSENEMTKLGKDAEWLKATFATFTVNDYLVQQSILYLALQKDEAKYGPQISAGVSKLFQEVTLDGKGNALEPRFENAAMVPFTPALRKEMVTMQTKLAAEGERVLGFAEWVVGKAKFENINLEYGEEKGKVAMKIEGSEAMWDIAEENVCGTVNSTAFKQAAFVGMISLQDPPRDDVPGAVEHCHTAGIQVVMVTGDHPITAKAISERIGILNEKCTISDWVANQKAHLGEKNYIKDEKTLNDILEKYLWLPATDAEKEEGRWTEHTNNAVLWNKKILDDGDDHTRCKDPTAKWWMGFRLHEADGTPITLKVDEHLSAGSDEDIFDPIKGLVVAGPQIDIFNDNDWRYALSRPLLTFSRTLPEQKQQIVMTMQRFHSMMSKGALDEPFPVDMEEKKIEKGEVEKEGGVPKPEKTGTSGNKAEDEEVRVARLQAGWTRKTPWDQGINESTHLWADLHQPDGCMNKKENREYERGLEKVDGEDREVHQGKEYNKKFRRYATFDDLQQPKVVAVTGDGVNDSPALKKADCGIAMGICGAPVAKDAADMVLLDDLFASIVEGIRQGRLIFDNLKKSIAYTLTSNIPEITPFLALICFQLPIPLETVMILCIDLGTDMLPAIALAYESPESDIMRRTPRNKHHDRLVNNKLIGMCYGQIGMIQAAAGFTCYFAVFSKYGLFFEDLSGTGFKYIDEGEKFVLGLDYDTRINILRQAQTSFLISIIVAQWTDVMICKTRVLSVFQQGMSNMMLNIGLIEELLLGMALCYVPICNAAFKTTAIEFEMWCYGIPFALLILAYDETRKCLLRYERAGQTPCSKGKEGDPNTFLEKCTYY